MILQKFFSVLFFVVFIAFFVNAEDNDSLYTTKYDNINLEEILASDRLLENYVNCLLEKGKCTPDGAELKRNLPDAINNDCGKCTEKQKYGSEQVMHFIIDNKPEWWDELEKMYNPDGSYKAAYLKKDKK